MSTPHTHEVEVNITDLPRRQPCLVAIGATDEPETPIPFWRGFRKGVALVSIVAIIVGLALVLFGCTIHGDFVIYKAGDTSVAAEPDPTAQEAKAKIKDAFNGD